MPCTLCAVHEGRADSSLRLLPTTDDMGFRLQGVLEDHGIAFERRSNLFELPPPGEQGRLIALLRHVLSEPERQAISVFAGAGDFVRPQPLDEWWQFHQTAWYAEALSSDRFEIWFQPVVDTGSQLVFAHECLVRLNSARLHNGAEILDAARIRNDIRAFDSHARRLSIRSAARQSLASGQLTEGRYFVNFMPASVYDPELCMKSTLTALEESGMKPVNIVFEVAESDLARDPVHLRRICDYFRLHGFGFAFDNVGTEGSTRQMVRDLRPDYIKLARGLVRNIEEPACAAAIQKLVEVSGRFGAGVIAQGVERMQSVENLWLLGVQCMQGYFFGRPSPVPSPRRPFLTEVLPLPRP